MDLEIRWKTEGGKGEFTYEFPDSVADAIARYGEATVLEGFRKSVVIYLQAAARRMFAKGTAPEDIAKTRKGVKIDFTQKPAADPLEAILKKLSKLSKEKREMLISSLKS